MIVEDDPLLSIVEEKLVSMLGYEVKGKARSGEETIDRIFDIDPSILIMDVQLSGELNGIETIQNLRDKQINIPVIFLSGDDSASIKQKAEDLNCVDFLLKPVTKNMLSNSLSKAVAAAELKSSFAA
ncbi:response regulator [Gracilimonas tropica]|uniref:response regulator n=1 Tax=Gracilimonas tropica TaxID=454600 RepID=UPI00146136D0|nr:response regulator [Gracilimonas tropica]